MIDYKLIRSWVRFKGKSKEDTYHYLTPEGQKKALAVPATIDQGIYNEGAGCYCYSFHFEFKPEMFESGKIPHDLQTLYDISELRVKSDYVSDVDMIEHQFSNVVPSQYLPQGKVKL